MGASPLQYATSTADNMGVDGASSGEVGAGESLQADSISATSASSKMTRRQFMFTFGACTRFLRGAVLRLRRKAARNAHARLDRTDDASLHVPAVVRRRY